MTFNMPSYWIQAARFCQGGRQKLNNEWTTYTPSDFEECKNGTVLSAQKTCKNGLYAIKEETLKRVSIQYEPNMMERQMKNSHLFIGIPLSWNSIIFGSYCIQMYLLIYGAIEIRIWYKNLISILFHLRELQWSLHCKGALMACYRLVLIKLIKLTFVDDSI